MIDILLRSLPALLSIIQSFLSWSIARNRVETERLVAIAQAAQALDKTLALATAAEQLAAESHAKDKTDGAFDGEFRRR